MRTVVGLAAIIAFTSASSNVLADDDSYRLGVQDRLRIHVYEWPALTGEFAVGANGDVTLPLIGRVPAKGLMPSELASSIADRLRQKTDLAQAPDTSVDVTQYRPFYILGFVEKPGEYPYRPGMMVVNALTIAGGTYRPPKMDREATTIAAGGEQRLIAVQRLALKAKQVRLQAEAEGLDALPASDSNLPPEAMPFLGKERVLFGARLEDYRNQTKFIGETISLLEQEIKSLSAQIGAVQQEKDSVQKELSDTRALVERGLAQAPRLLPLDRTVSQLFSKQKELETLILRAREQINQANLKSNSLKDERRSTALAELQTLAIQLNELDEREKTARLLGSDIPESKTTDLVSTEEMSLSFSVIRTTGSISQEFAATETTRLQPGDIVKAYRTFNNPNSAQVVPVVR
jgi:protein involved in polysaccharide export with SLBB domain